MSQSLELSAIIGCVAKRQLIEAYGGLCVYVPLAANLDAGHPLVRAIGLEAAGALAACFGGAPLNVPMDSSHSIAARHAAIRAARRRGASPRTIARDYHLSLRHVWRILAVE